MMADIKKRASWTNDEVTKAVQLACDAHDLYLVSGCRLVISIRVIICGLLKFSTDKVVNSIFISLHYISVVFYITAQTAKCKMITFFLF